ncbi:alpha/beta hydrolase [Mycobacterium bourgelatii]|nr:alpha/beta fold hydrolase [Mycobacterium bourgelatii]GFG92087.1 alpha/beta hydrolase [Mycobacterium bourgelatii]
MAAANAVVNRGFDHMLEVIDKGRSTDEHPLPLLFVHGAWHAAWCWDEHFLDFFAARGYRAVALSLRGHGGSSGRERLRWNRIGDYVDDVAEVAAQLPKKPILVGHSMGGFVVQHYLERDGAPGAILLAPIPPNGVLRVTSYIATHHPVEFAQVNARLRLAPLVANPKIARALLFSDAVPDAQVNSYQQRLQDEGYLGFLDMLVLDLVKTHRVHQIPTLVLGAEHDKIVAQSQIQRTASTYGAEMTIFPGMGHDMMLEPGWRQVAERMDNWLSILG